MQDEFIKVNFFGHSSFHPEIVKFLLENMVPRSALEQLNGACSNLSGLPSRITNLETGMDRIRSRLTALEGGGGGGGGGGPGGYDGGMSKTQKRKQQRAAAARAGVEELE